MNQPIRRKALPTAFRACVALAFLGFAPAARAQTNQAARLPSEPPKVLNIVHQQLVPGKTGAYVDLLTRIAGKYASKRIPVYWITSQSLTGPSEALTLNFFDSFAEAQQSLDVLGQATAGDPELAAMQEQLLEFVRRENNQMAVRRDDLGYRWNAIDFSRTRVLRVATVRVRQGHEAEFAEAIRTLRRAYGRLNADSPWVTYEVTAGAPASTFVILLPMHSLSEMDDYIARVRSLPEAEGPAAAARMQQIARDAYRSWDSELFIINPSASRVSAEFAAGDPRLWRAAH